MWGEQDSRSLTALALFLGIMGILGFVMNKNLDRDNSSRNETAIIVKEEIPQTEAPLVIQQPVLRTSASVPVTEEKDLQEEALNKMGLTKEGGSLLDLSGLDAPTSSTLSVSKSGI